ncbi:F-box protein At4g27050-like [Rutidosis leptorrhynchoides]|uniref:F-box protein At4g27050-like n=1 Tax=Rutidosis leptorrhynchoides TaxID=125765 RepID=UPI003A9984A9
MKRSSICNTYYNQQQEEDRISSLPDVLLVYILSFIDTKLSVQTSILSKRWLNLWTLLPVLNFDSSLFENIEVFNPNKFLFNSPFDRFVDHVIAHRNASIKIDSINIKVTDENAMARVFRYALSQNIPNLSVDTSEYLTKYREFPSVRSSDSLISLALKGMFSLGKLANFSALVSLRLERVKLVETEPFSCFPKLKELFLVNCKMSSELAGLEVIAANLSRLTIFSCFYHPIPYEKLVLFTPKLVFLELDGLIPTLLEACELPFLETVHIDCCFSFPTPRVADRNVNQPDENQQKLNLINIFRCVKNAKYVHLSPSTVKLLSLSYEKLVEEACPFSNLKVLNLIPPPNKPRLELHSSVASYLLKGSPGVVVKALPR